MILLNSSMGQFCELFCLAFNPLLCRSTVLCVLPHLANEEQSLAAFTVLEVLWKDALHFIFQNLYMALSFH